MSHQPQIGYEPPQQVASTTGDGDDAGYQWSSTPAWVKFSTEFLNAGMLAKISGNALKVFLAIALRVNANGEAWPSINRIMDDTGLARQTVVQATTELTAIPGLLDKSTRPGKHNKYRPGFVANGKANLPTSLNIRPPTRLKNRLPAPDQSSMQDSTSLPSKTPPVYPTRLEQEPFPRTIEEEENVPPVIDELSQFGIEPKFRTGPMLPRTTHSPAELAQGVLAAIRTNAQTEKASRQWGGKFWTDRTDKCWQAIQPPNQRTLTTLAQRFDEVFCTRFGYETNLTVLRKHVHGLTECAKTARPADLPGLWQRIAIDLTNAPITIVDANSTVNLVRAKIAETARLARQLEAK